MSLELTRHGEAHRADDLRKIGIAKDDTPSKSPGKRLEHANYGMFYCFSVIMLISDSSFMFHFMIILCCIFIHFLIFALRSCGFEQTTRGESISIVILVAHSWCLTLLQHGRCWSILQRSKESCQALHWLTFVADSRSAAAQKTDSLGDGTAVAAGGPAVTFCRPDLLRSCVAVGQRCSSCAKI